MMDAVKVDDSNLERQEIPCLCSQRWILGYLGFFFGAVFNIMRTDINIAIVCMATDGNINVTNVVNITKTLDEIENMADTIPIIADSCSGEIKKKVDDIMPEFTWDRGMQSHVLSAYFYGFVVSQIPCSWLIGRFGGKMIVAVFTAISCVSTVLIPVLARTHVNAVIVARIVVGIASSPLPAAWVSLVGKWALSNERSRMMMVFWCGKTIGAIFGYATSGFLCAHGFDNGWGSIFYLHGIIGFVFILLWIYFTSNSPDTHPRITQREREALVKRLHPSSSKREKFVKVPWTKMFTSLSVWAIFITQLCDNATYFLVLICLPLFAKEVLKFDVESNGVYTSLPFLTRSASLICAAVMADYVNTRGWVSRTCNRKIFQITSFLGSALFLVLATYLPCDKREVVILFVCFSTFFQSIALSAGFPCNLVDMTPRFAPFIYSVSNTIGACSGFLVPLGVGYLTQHKTMEEWRFVFWLAAGVAVLGSVAYGLFSSSELVSWDSLTTQELEITVGEKSAFIVNAKDSQQVDGKTVDKETEINTAVNDINTDND